MRYLYIRHNASIMAFSIICPPEGPLDTYWMLLLMMCACSAGSAAFAHRDSRSGGHHHLKNNHTLSKADSPGQIKNHFCA